MMDGRAERTPLAERVLRHFGLEDESRYCELIYQRHIPVERLKTTVPLVFEAWLEGDPAAVALIDSAADDYALTAHAMIARTENPAAEMVFGGGVFQQAPEQFWKRLERDIRARCPEATVKRPQLPPECGAAVMAAFSKGQDARAFFNRLAESLREGRRQP